MNRNQQQNMATNINSTNVDQLQQATDGSNKLPLPASTQASSLESSVPVQRQPAAGSGMQLHNLRPAGAGHTQPSASMATTSASSTPTGLSQSATKAAAVDLVQNAAAKFKMLRSNTLAAAFGRSSGEPAGSGAGPSDLLAMRTKDERIVQTLRNRLD